MVRIYLLLFSTSSFDIIVKERVTSLLFNSLTLLAIILVCLFVFPYMFMSTG